MKPALYPRPVFAPVPYRSALHTPARCAAPECFAPPRWRLMLRRRTEKSARGEPRRFRKLAPVLLQVTSPRGPSARPTPLLTQGVRGVVTSPCLVWHKGSTVRDASAWKHYRHSHHTLAKKPGLWKEHHGGGGPGGRAELALAKSFLDLVDAGELVERLAQRRRHGGTRVEVREEGSGY